MSKVRDELFATGNITFHTISMGTLTIRNGMIGDHEREVEVVPVEEPRFTEPVEAPPEKGVPAPSEPAKEPEKVPA